MRRIIFFWIFTVVILNPVFAGAQNFSDRFAKGDTSFGGELGSSKNRVHDNCSKNPKENNSTHKNLLG